MVTKAELSRRRKAIEKAKKAYGVGESWSDKILARLIASRWTFVIAGVVVILAAVGAWVVVV